ncbi:hypothetical protein VINI7043_02365 [Vibrio nigripulchritudo ATCC 27043]|nr:hypothetical protein VINI7043_02365 [Vibrio nigripulchritudo ATCC 27043]
MIFCRLSVLVIALPSQLFTSFQLVLLFSVEHYSRQFESKMKGRSQEVFFRFGSENPFVSR